MQELKDCSLLSFRDCASNLWKVYRLLEAINAD